MNLQNSVSDFGIYSSSGELLKGSPRFEEYTALAKQLDIKRTALYFESRDNKVILGCSLLARIRMGREERVVFIEVFSSYKLDPEGMWIKKFYEKARAAVEGLESIRYEVIGLWEAGDLDSFDFYPPSGDSLAYPIGKVLSMQRVSAGVSGPAEGVSLAGSLVSQLKPVLPLGFSFALSLYPSEVDFSAGPGESDPDLYLENGNIILNPVSRDSKNLEPSYPAEYYEFRYRAFVRMTEKQGFPENIRNRKELLGEILKALTIDSGSEITDSFLKKGDVESLFELCRDSPEALKTLADSLIAKGRTYRIVVFRDKKLAADVVRKLSRTDSVSKGLEAFMLDLYRGLSRSEKGEVQRYLLENGLFYESFVSELAGLLVETSRKSKAAHSLLSLCAGVSFSGNSSRKKAFISGLHRGLDGLGPAETVYFLKYILSTLDGVAEGGRLLLKILVDQSAGNDFVLELSENDVIKLDTWLGSDYFELREEKNHKRRKKLMKRVRVFSLIFGVFAVFGILAFAFLNYGPGLPGIGPSGNEVLPFNISSRWLDNVSPENESEFGPGNNSIVQNETGLEVLGNVTINRSDSNFTNSNVTNSNFTDSNFTDFNITNSNVTPDHEVVKTKFF